MIMSSFIRQHSSYFLSWLRSSTNRGAHSCLGSGAAPAPSGRGFLDERKATAARRLRGFFDDESGVLVLLVALAMPVLAGTMCIAAEASYWYQHKRAMQNAADAAVITAATNASSNYASEATAVAAQYFPRGFPPNMTVTPAQTNNATGCPANQNCYTVTVSDKVPLFLSQVIGYLGTTTVNNQRMTALSAAAVATSASASATTENSCYVDE